MSDNTTNNKRIAKNTLYMYLRMIVMMVISLYTSRIVLQTLGVDNYGIYNIVGSIVVFFTFINNGLGFATKRYITADIAERNIKKGMHTFNVCFNAHFIIAGIIFFLAELIGPFVIYKYLNIPEGREFAAQIVYQISIITTILSIIQSPFGTVIVAHEDMSVYAYFTIVDVILKLGLIFLVQALNGDKLIIYALLTMMVVIINIAYFSIYCFHKYPICRFRRIRDNKMLKEIFSFMGWNVMGQSATVLTNQGVGVLVNLFFNVAANAAMGVSNSITHIVSQFVSNFQVAFNPQIIKSYNTGNHVYLQSLILRSSKISSYLILLFLVPLIFEADTVLTLWLGDYPQYALEFCICTLFCIYMDAISAPLYMVMYSQTNIKNYQIVISSVYSLCFFLGWIALFIGYPPYSVIIARFLVLTALLSVRLVFVKKLIPGFIISDWVLQIPIKSLLILTISTVCTGIIANLLQTNRYIHVITISAFSIAINALLMLYIGFSKQERLFVVNLIMQRIKR